jgi:5'(3')-deoxyribonucleotidase
MAKPVIALDIDDVLVDTVTAMFGDYNKRYGTALTKEHHYTRDIKLLGVSDYKIAAERVERYLASEAYANLVPFADAIRAIRRLNAQYDFIAVTSRPKFTEQMTRDWIKKHFDDMVQDVIFTHYIMAADTSNHPSVSSKVGACKDIGAVYMVEDHLHHAIPVAESGVKVFLLDQPWNQHAALPGTMSRVRNWNAIEEAFFGEA